MTAPPVARTASMALSAAPRSSSGQSDSVPDAPEPLWERFAFPGLLDWQAPGLVPSESAPTVPTARPAKWAPDSGRPEVPSAHLRPVRPRYSWVRLSA
ncbi:MAG: hypothetical protein O2958_07300 [Gemmatimonadetes bacterium]|nr:hypothetical protein [Gemmatimonadota bacterium]MDA1103859.1 hypothetical protein [Gemmatimonadota bacterium]